MNSQLKFWFALLLSGCLFGCSTEQKLNSPSPAYGYSPDFIFDPSLGQVVEKTTNAPSFNPATGELVGRKPPPLLSPAQEIELRAKLFAIAGIIDRTTLESKYNEPWSHTVEIHSPGDIPYAPENVYHPETDGAISEFEISCFQGGQPGAGYLNLEQGDCGIRVRAFLQQKRGSLDKKWGEQKVPSENVFQQILFGEIGVEVDVATHDKAFKELLRKNLTPAAQ